MTDLIQFVLRHGYAVLFGAVFVEQIGIPVPSAPVLLAAGALSAGGNLSLMLVILSGVLAALPGDLIWYQVGRRRGDKVLRLICRLALEPDSCVRRTEDLFVRHGGRSLLVARFIPGLNTAASPMAGHLEMSLARFLALDVTGEVLYIGAYSLAGYIFSSQIEDFALMLARLGNWAIFLALTALAGYLGWKYLQRRRFFRKLRVARISPEELIRKLNAGDGVVILDLRNEFASEEARMQLPGAIRMLPAELELRHEEIPRDRDIVLYCT